jgi:putative peptidoglycan lipid II flippase
MSLARDVATVGAATMLSRLLGFIRDAGIAAVLGAGVLSDAFFAALQIPNLFRRLLAEGALNAAFVPMWLRMRDESGPRGARRFGEATLGTMLVALGLATLLCVLFAPLVVRLIAPGFRMEGVRFALAIDYVRLAVPYVAVAGLVAVSAAVLNAEGRVGAAAFGLVIFNAVFVAAVACVIVFGAEASPFAGALLSAAVVLAGLAQLVLVGGAMLRLKEPPVRPRLTPAADVRHFFAQAVPGVLAGGVPQLKLMAGAMVASASQSAVSWLYYANRLYELPLGVVSIAISAVLVPRIAASVRAGEEPAVAAAQSRAIEIALGLALPAAMAFAMLAEPIAGGLFERGAFGPRDTAAVAAALAAISAGLPGHVLEKVLGAVSFAHEDTRTPMFAALGGLVAAVTGALLAFPHYGHTGIAGAIAVSGWIGAVTLAVVLARRRWLHFEHDLGRRVALIGVATIAMAAVLYVLRHETVSWYVAGAPTLLRLAALVLLVSAGLAIYCALLHVFGVARIGDVIAAVRRRI